MSPKADPLPPDMQIKRESPMIKESGTAGRRTPKSAATTEKPEGGKSVRIKSAAEKSETETEATENAEGGGETTDHGSTTEYETHDESQTTTARSKGF